ncbi:polyphosphate kinase 1 [Pedobacter duraquae]|uniref:Polyphosphate kinase n=1 Tax=Pedobacter duraquae TaxID=425511 RepID=A0A4R6IL51_9SPHI|nr:polyphosphate kinase 1 [Pedobacter duraquae]TDO22803.1 polyphosphate kinase [Pedobacter duraquae]
MEEFLYFNRDLSWLSFNERVLSEAESADVPLLEKIKFLSIYSSNLDEFYRVRMPVLMAIENADDIDGLDSAYTQANKCIDLQQQHYGEILEGIILPGLEAQNIDWIYKEEIPASIEKQVTQLFIYKVEPVLQKVTIAANNREFFAENNKLYQGVVLQDPTGNERLEILTIPSDQVPRLYLMEDDIHKYIVFLDDIIKHNLKQVFPGDKVIGAYNIKVTRDAEMLIEDEVDEDIVTAMEKELLKRDFGAATRFLCEPNVPLRHLYTMMYALNLSQASVVIGGVYHNLRDLADFPFQDPAQEYPKWPAADPVPFPASASFFEQISNKDILINTPYDSYAPVLQFFEEAATDAQVTEVYCTLYRVASQSKVIQSLIKAAKNGKKVSVMLELKARFDEANNIRWSSKLKAAGVKIIYSSSAFKVHAKVALVKRKVEGTTSAYGLFSTGNLNETTARFYTDHIVLTASEPMLKELERLFGFLGKKKKKPALEDRIPFQHLLVAQFNLQSRFLELLDREIVNAGKGLPAHITIKLNNLEEKILINKLYEASNAGVIINLIVRSICCLVPGVPGQSENITVKRIVDRYLEHGRLFLFHNNGNEELFMGSADWMNRNIYSRIEVCFPVYDQQHKAELKEILKIQWEDTVKAVELNSDLKNIRLKNDNGIRSQEEIYKLLTAGSLAEKQ